MKFRLFKRKAKAAPPKPKMDAGLNVSKHSADTAGHWAFVKPETAAGAVKHRDRAEARTKAREEFLNNPYAAGFADTFALYLVGTGPRLRFKGYEDGTTDGAADPALIRYVETLWRNWSDSIRLAKTLRLGVKSLVVDGECFLLESVNPKRDIFGINYTVIDPQRIGNPGANPWTPRLQDGLFFDEFGNLEAFCLYKIPEFESTFYDTNRYEVIPATSIHYAFKENLPEVTRGWSWFAPVLESMGRLRDYEDGVIEAAKSAANVFATLETQNGFIDGSSALTIGEDTPYYPWTTHTPQRNKIIQLPPDTTLKSFQPSQPTTNVPDFISNQVARLGRGIGLTRNRATGSSHEYNFASGKLDSQPFDMLVQCLQRDLLELDIMDKLFADFYTAILPRLYDRFPDVPEPEEADWAWRWPKPPLVDEEAQARADAIRVKSYQATVKEVWEERHPDSKFEDVRAEIDADRKAYPEIYGAAAGDSDGIAPAAAGTRIDEPKAPEIGKQRGEE